MVYEKLTVEIVPDSETENEARCCCQKLSKWVLYCLIASVCVIGEGITATLVIWLRCDLVALHANKRHLVAAILLGPAMILFGLTCLVTVFIIYRAQLRKAKLYKQCEKY